MLERIGQALLDDSIGREVDRLRNRDGLAVDVQPYGKARACDLLEQRVEPAEAGLGRELELVVVAAQRPEQEAHLGERGAAGLLDAAQRIRLLAERRGKLVPDSADLEHHHADRVGDDVVELAGDPRALLRDGDARSRLAIPLGLCRTCLGSLGLLGPLAQREARQPSDREHHRREDEIAGCVGRVVVDDDRRAAEQDRQSQPRLHGVAEVAEQERGGHADGEEACREHDDAPVGE